MAKNKILVQIIDHENGDSVLGQDYFESREKAEEFKRISDRAYGKLLGEGQTESPLRSLNADTNHHFLYPLNGRPSARDHARVAL